MSEFYWLPDDRYAKLKGQMTTKINALLASAYSMHGYRDYAPDITREIMGLVEESWDIIRGRDKPLPTPRLRDW